MRIGRWRGVTVVALAVVGMSEPAAGQIVRQPDDVRACLCKEQAVATLNDQLQGESRAYEDKRRAFEALDKQVQTSRPQVNVSKPADVDAFKHLLEQRDDAADTLAGPATKSYADAVERYNQAVSDYNGTCAGKSFDADEMTQLKRTLSCSKQ
jgi:hypothetical protein